MAIPVVNVNCDNSMRVCSFGGLCEYEGRNGGCFYAGPCKFKV